MKGLVQSRSGFWEVLSENKEFVQLDLVAPQEIQEKWLNIVIAIAMPR